MEGAADLASRFPGLLKRIGSVADRSGMEVYAVGGFIRDLLARVDVDQRDIDLTVVGDALSLARRVKGELGAKILVTYERFGTTLLVAEGYKLEFVTARKERYHPESRKPIVEKAGPESDLARRDFTINALAVGLNKGTWGILYDPFEGLKDLRNRVIRTPLNPRTTFEDDPLRILRAIRFAAELDFRIELQTEGAIRRMVHRLEIVSKERIADELTRIIANAAPPSKGIDLLDRLGVLSYVLPEVAQMKGVEQRKDFHHQDVFFHTLQVLDNVAMASGKLELRLASLFHDVGKPPTQRFDPGVGWTFHRHAEVGAEMVEPIARRLQLSKASKAYIQKLIRLHMRPILLASEEVSDSALRRLIVQAGEDLADLFELCRADVSSGNPNRVTEDLENLERLRDRMSQIRERDMLGRFQSPVGGDKIMEVCGISPGPLVGRLKNEIEEAILDGKIPNEHRAALAYLNTIKDKFTGMA